MFELFCEDLFVRCIWHYFIIIWRTSLSVNICSIVCMNVKEPLARSRRHIWSLKESSDCQTHNHFVRKRTINHLAKVAEWLSFVLSTYLHGGLVCMLLHTSCMYLSHTYWSHTSFRVNSHSIVRLNVKEFLARNSRHIWSLNESNKIWIQNHLVT